MSAASITRPPDQGAPARLVRADHRPAELFAFESATVDFFVRAAALLGIPKSVAAIYGICFASAEPLSSADIGRRLDISSGSISQGLRVLREIGALKPVGRPEDRRETFEPDLELRKLVGRWIQVRLQEQLRAGQGRLADLAQTVPGNRAASATVLRNRIGVLRKWHNKGRALLPVMKAFLKVT